MRTAYEWGLSRKPKPSCKEALEWRESLGEATQKEAWAQCYRGDWLFWQLRHGLTDEEFLAVMPALLRAINRIVDRVVRKYALTCGVFDVEHWAENWLNGIDRSDSEATAACTAAWAAENFAACWAAKSAANNAVSANWSEWIAESRAAASSAMRTAWAAMTTAAIAESAASAERAMIAAESAVARKAERKQKAEDIRREIPEWIWKV